MEIFNLDKTYKIPKLEINSCTIGNFDGVHIGHVNLIKETKEENLKTLVITFDDINKEKIFDLEDKKNKLNNLDIDYLIILKFEDFKNLFYDEFIKMLKKLSVKKVTIGKDFKFGFKQEGDYIDLEKKFEVKIINDFYLNNEKVSSSLIRENLKEGNIEKVNHLLGYEYYCSGVVQTGNKLGNTIGFPTVNILHNNLIKNGVYHTNTIYNNKVYNSITNIGVNPTFNLQENFIIETHIIDFNEDVYNKEITLLFIKKIREEKKFNNKEELIEQLNKDKQSVLK